MPEGDTVFKLASMLRPLLQDERLERVSLRDVPRSGDLRGKRVLKVETLGKHLLLHLDNAHLIRVHLGMHGSWHRYRLAEAWKKPRSKAKVVLQTPETVLVCFEPMEVELFPAAQRRWHNQLSRLGPDLLSPQEPNWEKILNRARTVVAGDTPLGELLLDQRAAAGLGNVYKSELAFMGPLEQDEFTPTKEGYSPLQPVGTVSDTAIVGLYQRGRRLLQANLGGWHRTTRAPADKVGRQRLYVYDRAGEKCWRCGDTISSGLQGLGSRITYWCSACQR